MGDYRTIRALREGKVIELEGLRFMMARDANGEEAEIQPGDLYIAERNTGPQLLIAKQIVRPEDGSLAYVIAAEVAYPYDLRECVKIAEMPDGAARQRNPDEGEERVWMDDQMREQME